MKRLAKDAFGPPYFLAYRLVLQNSLELSAAYGELTSESVDAYALLYVEARVGDRSLDNTDLAFQGWQSPAAEDPAVLRQLLWSLSDRAYKSALSGFLEKKAKRATEFVPDVLDDFSREEAEAAVTERPAPRADRDALAGVVKSLSAVWRRFPYVYDSSAGVQWRPGRRLLLTSEGTRLATEAARIPGTLRVSAMTRAPDGMRIDVHDSWAFRGLSDLPSRADLEARVERLARDLGEAREAPLQSPMAAPAILDPEFTGVLFHEALGHKLEGQRQRDPAQSQVFKDLVGKAIIPAFLSVHDDPTLTEFQGRPLSGHYAFDSEGVRARRVALVEGGVLRDFLMSRWPVKGFPSSNGHGRSDPYHHPTGRMANLIISAEGPVPKARLEAMLLERIRKAGKPYGFLLAGAFGGENPNSRDSAQTLEVRPRLIYRIDARDGRRTMVRGVKLVGTPLVFLNRILAAADDATLANEFVCGAESGHVPVSQIAPSVLVSEVELQRLPEDRSVPPILPSPFHDKN